MLTNNKFRTLIIALSATTLMACNSGPSKEEVEAESNRVAAEQVQMEQARVEKVKAENARVEAAKVEQMKRAKQQAADEKATLMNQNTVYFDFDRATVKSDFMPVLKKHAEYLVANPGQSIVIEGHCDQRGTPEYNIALGERRAKSVESYFRNAGVRSSQVTVVSYGEEKPAVMGASEYAMAQNRRGIVVYQ